MDSLSRDQLQEPQLLQFLACEVKYPVGNFLIHQFVLNTCRPSDSRSESDIRAALRSFPGARANARNEDGFTALHVAVIERNSFMVKMLLSCLPTIDVDARCAKGGRGTALHFAAAVDYFDRAFLFIKANYGRAALDKAAKEKENSEMVKVLVEYGCAVDAVDKYGNTALHIAAEYNRINIVKMISSGAALNAKNCMGYTPLYKAVRYGCSETVKVLVAIGAAVDERDNDGRTPLHCAAVWNRINILQLLIRKGAALNAKDYLGWTPLHGATKSQNLEEVRVLIESGAAVNERSNDGSTPLHCAAEASFNVASKCTEIVKLLIRKGAYLNARAQNGSTPLHAAVGKGCFENVKILVESGAAVGTTNCEIALRIAKGRNDIEIIEYLNCRLPIVHAVHRDDGAKLDQRPFKKMRRN